MTRTGTFARIAAILAAVLGVGLAATSRAQLVPSDPIPWWVGQLFVTPGAPPLWQEYLRSTGTGGRFQLLHYMRDDQDPLNQANDVIAVSTWWGAIGAVVRNLPAGTKVADLDGRINLKYFFPTRTCDGGSPRVQLAFDLDGDGHFDANALGYVGNAQYGLGCLTGVWDYNDMTDDVSRWDLTWNHTAWMSLTWDQAVQVISASYPNHRVLSGALVDDSSGYAHLAWGESYYDRFTMGDLTLENHEDTVN